MLLQFIDVMKLVDLLLHFSPSVSSMTQVIMAQTSPCGYSCESMKFWAFNLTPYDACYSLSVIFVNFVNIKQELLRYVQQNFASFSLCVLQGSRVTPLKCGEIYDMDFIANFTENTTVKKLWKSVNICQTFERMCSGTVFIETRCIFNRYNFCHRTFIWWLGYDWNILELFANGP